jgi:hypothetical protein
LITGPPTVSGGRPSVSSVGPSSNTAGCRPPGRRRR